MVEIQKPTTKFQLLINTIKNASNLVLLFESHLPWQNFTSTFAGDLTKVQDLKSKGVFHFYKVPPKFEKFLT
jgi:hypothetical protein